MKWPENINDEFYYEYCKLIENLSSLPHRILQNHHLEALSQMILHELSHDQCFGLKRAVYLVDNPDFDHLVGAAGFSCDECALHKKDLWGSPESFVKDMKVAHFHNDVKTFIHHSLRKKDFDLNNAIEVKELGSFVGINNPQIVSWGMKHGNHGILMFESDKDIPEWRRQMLQNSVALLSL
jgi:hypothetical protein